MSELSHHDDSNMNFKENENDESKLQQQNYNIIQPKRNVPIKTQIKQLEKELSDLRAGLNENKKALRKIEHQLTSLKCN